MDNMWVTQPSAKCVILQTLSQLQIPFVNYLLRSKSILAGLLQASSEALAWIFFNLKDFSGLALNDVGPALPYMVMQHTILLHHSMIRTSREKKVHDKVQSIPHRTRKCTIRRSYATKLQSLLILLAITISKNCKILQILSLQQSASCFRFQ